MKRLSTMATALCAAIGIAAAPAPAAADGEDIAKIIAGLAVAGIVAKAIDDRRDRKKAKAAQARAAQKAQTFGTFGNGGIRHDGRRVIEGTVRPYGRNNDERWPRLGPDYRRLALPERCLVTVSTDRGDRLAYGAHCLDRRYQHANRLPGACETVVRTPRGFRTVYGARCLARDGWNVARH